MVVKEGNKDRKPNRGKEINSYLYCHEPTYPKAEAVRLGVDSWFLYVLIFKTHWPSLSSAEILCNYCNLNEYCQISFHLLL